MRKFFLGSFLEMKPEIRTSFETNFSQILKRKFLFENKGNFFFNWTAEGSTDDVYDTYSENNE